MRRALGLGESCAAGYVGRLVEHKGVAFLIKSIKLCQRRGLNVKCVIAGEGPDRESLEKLVNYEGLNETVIFLGLRHDVADLLSAIDLLVQPSIVREGLPLSLCEGASIGLPLVATAIGGNTEIVLDQENGFIVPPRDAETLAEKIGRLATDDSLRRSMGDRSRRVWEERFTVEMMVKKTGDLYGRCLEENRR